MIILYFVWPYNRLPRQKSWTLAGGVQQHLAVPLYIKSYDYGNVVLCCEILQIQIHLYGHNYLHCITITIAFNYMRNCAFSGCIIIC